MGHLIPAGTGFRAHQEIELIKGAPDFLLPEAKKPEKAKKETQEAKEAKS